MVSRIASDKDLKPDTHYGWCFQEIGNEQECYLCPSSRTNSVLQLSIESWQYENISYRLAKCDFCGSASTFPLPSDDILKSLYLNHLNAT